MGHARICPINRSSASRRSPQITVVEKQKVEGVEHAALPPLDKVTL
jgi:hypothetical protein